MRDRIFLLLSLWSSLTFAYDKWSKELNLNFFDTEFQLSENYTWAIDFPNIKGNLDILNTKVIGLNTLNLIAQVDPKTQIASGSISSDSILGVEGLYSLALEQVYCAGTFQIDGSGVQENSVKRFQFGIQIKLDDEQKGYIQVSDIKLQLSFDAISLNLVNMNINNFNLDWIWKPLNRFLNGSFKELFVEIQEPMIKILSRILNSHLQQNQQTFKELMTTLKEI